MKKAIILLILTIFAVGAMTACGSKNNTTTNSTVSPTGTVSKNLYHPVGGEFTLGQYKGLEYTMEKVEVTDEDIQKQIDLLLQKTPNYKKIENPDHTDVREGDIVNIDYVGKVAGVAFDGGTASAQDLEIGSNAYIPGFESSLVGAQIGTTVDINVTFPENYGSTNLAGADAVFTVTLNYFAEEFKEIDNAYVARNLSQYATTVDGLKTYIRNYLEEDAEEEIDEKMWDALIGMVIDNSTFTKILPEDVDYYYELSLSTLRQYAQAYGMTEEELYNMYYDTEEMDYNAFLAKCREQAERSVKEFMVLQEIVKKENLIVTADEYAKTAEEYRLGVGAASVEALESSYGKEYIEYCILNDMALDLIHDSATIHEAK